MAVVLQEAGKLIHMAKQIFTSEQKQRITDAVAELEKESSGELVLYYAKSSDNYAGAVWKLTGIIGIAFTFVASLAAYLWVLPALFTPIVISIVIALVMLATLSLSLLLPLLRVAVTSDNVVEHRVLTKARDMFLQEQVFDTVDRTGILIFISALERKVAVIGDSGINQKITQDDWENVVRLVIAGIKQKQMTEGIIKAVDACKELLLGNGFTVKPNDTNELPDAIRIEE